YFTTAMTQKMTGTCIKVVSGPTSSRLQRIDLRCNQISMPGDQIQMAYNMFTPVVKMCLADGDMIFRIGQKYSFKPILIIPLGISIMGLRKTSKVMIWSYNIVLKPPNDTV